MDSSGLEPKKLDFSTMSEEERIRFKLVRLPKHLVVVQKHLLRNYSDHRPRGTVFTTVAEQRMS